MKHDYPRRNRVALGIIGTFCLTFLVVSVVASAVHAQGRGPLFATGISGGKTKPLVDIENRLKGPEQVRPIQKATPVQRREAFVPDTTQTVEDASRYQLYIDPVYPREARLVNKEADVEVHITFDKNGKMKGARIVSCTTPGWNFEQAVLAASLEARLAGHGDREVTVKARLKFKLQ